jgi:hypothetical protein
LLLSVTTVHTGKKGVPIVRNLNIKRIFLMPRHVVLRREFAKANGTKAAKALDVITVHTVRISVKPVYSFGV